jgi:hypothetical protein
MRQRHPFEPMGSNYMALANANLFVPELAATR